MLLALHVIVVFIFLLLGILFFKGKGTSLIAGFNTAPKSEKQSINVKKLTRFVGKLMFISARCWMIIILSDLIQSETLNLFGAVLFVVSMLSGVIYANTGNRFKV